MSFSPAKPSKSATSFHNITPMQYMNAFLALKYIPYRFFAIVEKYNKRSVTQLRALIITDTHIYSATPQEGSIQRCIEIKLISEVRFCKSLLQIGLVVPAEHDYLFSVTEKEAFEEFRNVLPKVPWVEDAVTLIGQLKVEKPGEFSRRAAESVRWRVNTCHVDSAAMSNAVKTPVAAGKIVLSLSASICLDDSIAGLPNSSSAFLAPVTSADTLDATTPRMLSTSYAMRDSPARHVETCSIAVGPDEAMVIAVAPPLPLAPVVAPPPVAAPQDANPSFALLYKHEIESLRAQLETERRKRIDAKVLLAEMVAANRANLSALRRNGDELRCHVERLSVENMLLKRPMPEL